MLIALHKVCETRIRMITFASFVKQEHGDMKPGVVWLVMVAINTGKRHSLVEEWCHVRPMKIAPVAEIGTSIPCKTLNPFRFCFWDRIVACVTDSY